MFWWQNLTLWRESPPCKLQPPCAHTPRWSHSTRVWPCPVSPGVFDLLTCWRAAQGLLIFPCDPNIHYTDLCWAPTMCRHASLVLWAQEWTTQRVAGFFLVDPGVDDSESGWLFPSSFLSAYCVQARFSCLVDPGVDDSESGWLFPSSLSPWTLGLSWTWMGHSSIHLLIWKVSYSEAYAYLHDCVIE